MPHKITITFEDGTSHIYDGVPEEVTPEQIQERAAKDFSGLNPVSIDRGPAEEATRPESKTLKPEDYAEYTTLVKNPETTPEGLAKWIGDKGYGTPDVGSLSNLLAFHHDPKNSSVEPANYYTKLNDPLGQQADIAVGQGAETQGPQEEKQWGLDPETLKTLGMPDMGDAVNRASPLRWLQSLPAAAADGVIRGLQAGLYGVDQLAEWADKAYNGSDLDKAVADVTSVHQRPSELIGGLPEAFPMELAGRGPMELGGVDLRATKLGRLLPTPKAVEEPIQPPAVDKTADVEDLTSISDRMAAGEFGESAKKYASSGSRTPPKPEETVAKLTAALNAAGKASEEQKALYKAERSKRFAQVRKAYQEGGGKAAFEKALAAFKGELPKADFESVRKNFSAEEEFSLYEHINTSSLSEGGKTSASSGLEKLLDGRLPQPRELEHLGDIFPPDFIKAAISNRSKISKIGGLAGDLWNTPKSLQSTADLSGPLRQGLGLIHRGEFWKSLGPMVKVAFSPKTGDALEAAIKAHPNYDLATESGLSLTTSGKLGVNEDMFRSHLAEKIPVWGKVVQGSERAYVGFLNKLRFDTFNNMLEQAKKLGHDIDDPDIAAGISRYINVMTGRGGLGNLEKNVKELNNVLYSPGLISSRLQILSAPVQSIAGKGFIADLPAGMRMEAVKSYVGIIGFNSAALTTAAIAGKNVNLDPLSSDFLKLKDGDTRLDFAGGLSQYIVAGARAIMRQRTTSGENGVTRDLKGQGNTPLDNDVTFVMNKMHPTLTLLLDQQRGKTTVGEPFEWQKGIIDRLTPMGFPDIAATLKEHGSDPGVMYSVLGLIGASLSNYHSKSDDKPEPTEVDKLLEEKTKP